MGYIRSKFYKFNRISMSEFWKLKEELSKLEEGESIVVLTPVDNCTGYFLGIGDNVVNRTWAITQEEVNQLAILCNKYKSK